MSSNSWTSEAVTRTVLSLSQNKYRAQLKPVDLLILKQHATAGEVLLLIDIVFAPHTVSMYRLTSLYLSLVHGHINHSPQTYQSVTASSHNLISCSLVPPKCSTNSSPNTFLATLSFRINRAVASFNDFANLSP
jgi:hypothetical protein